MVTFAIPGPRHSAAFDRRRGMTYETLMCQAMLDKGEFDPELCPLLKGLSPEQIAVRMKQLPISACRRSLDDHAEGKLALDEIECPAEQHIR